MTLNYFNNASVANNYVNFLLFMNYLQCFNNPNIFQQASLFNGINSFIPGLNNNLNNNISNIIIQSINDNININNSLNNNNIQNSFNSLNEMPLLSAALPVRAISAIAPIISSFLINYIW